MSVDLWKIQNELIAADETVTKSSGRMLNFGGGAAAATPVEEPPKTEKKYKWSTSLDTKYVFPFATATAHKDISAIDWSSAKGVARSESGAEGVFFVETPVGAIVVKGSRSLGSEFFASLLSLRLGVLAPRSRVLSTNSEEGIAMLKKLKSLDPTWQVVTCLHDQSHVLLKEYVGGGQNLGSARDDESLFLSGGEVSKAGRIRLRDIGRLMVTDVLMNNGDRLPLVWANAGNAGNVMFCAGYSAIVTNIDSQMTSINAHKFPKEFQQYVDRVGSLVERLSSNYDSSSHEIKSVVVDFDPVRTSILQHTGIDVGSMGMNELATGFVQGIRSLKANPLTEAQLNLWLSGMTSHSQSSDGSEADNPFVGLENVSVDFLMAIQNVLLSTNFD